MFLPSIGWAVEQAKQYRFLKVKQTLQLESPVIVQDSLVRLALLSPQFQNDSRPLI